MGYLIAIAVIAGFGAILYFSHKNKIKEFEKLIYEFDKIYDYDKSQAVQAWDAVKAFMSENGFSEKKFDKVSESMYLRMAEEDDLLALKKICEIKEEDIELSQKYLLRAAQLGDIESMYYLGMKYDKAYNELYSFGFGYNPVEAFNWYSKAAQYGHEDAAQSVASAYYFGEGVKKDEEKAFNYAVYFSNRGFSKLTFFLVSYFYKMPYSPKYDRKKAITLLEREIQRRDPKNYVEAAEMLGGIFDSFYNGIAVDGLSNIRKAAYCYYLAYCADPENSFALECFQKTGYRATQSELSTWKNDANNLRYNP